ncbi:MAG: TetR/AcrR family transcriptional regulator [Actinophytocola sp.]|uniref:TetR/AcrR family transcriptional regulator n=1 Tax=Actinophytocola sp. TaxID=1872138 RepID=UPI003C73DEA7
MADTKGARTSARLVESMLELIQTHGYSGTGLNTVVGHANAPKGSLYFHFPGGKEALGEKAIELAADRFRTMVPAEGSPAEVVGRVLTALARLIEEHDYQLGCPVSVVTLEMGGQSDRLRTACANAFESWVAPLAAHLVAYGREPSAARSLATATVSMVEGAVIMARAQRSVTPLRCAADTLRPLLG